MPQVLGSNLNRLPAGMERPLIFGGWERGAAREQNC